MALFDFLKSALAKVLGLMRRGFDKFLAQYGPRAKEVLLAEFKDYIAGGVSLHEWRDEGFAVFNKVFNADGRIPGTWITILLNVAYDMVKVAQENR